MPTDPFTARAQSLESPATHLEEVSPSDAGDLARVSRAFNVDGAGAIRVTTLEGQTGTVHVPSGGTIAIRATRVWATGTTATGIVALS
ncbi:MAG: spike base protein, RCAP_Rcc01079 family [Hasllibacter sp.]